MISTIKEFKLTRSEFNINSNILCHLKEAKYAVKEVMRNNQPTPHQINVYN